jgi:hypothetical protein
MEAAGGTYIFGIYVLQESKAMKTSLQTLRASSRTRVPT